MWDIDRIVTISWRKQLHEVPWADPIMIENDEVPWVVQYHYGSFRHFPEPLHATQDITKESMKMLVQCSCMFRTLSAPTDAIPRKTLSSFSSSFDESIRNIP
jgi:hypothetical protein